MTTIDERRGMVRVRGGRRAGTRARVLETAGRILLEDGYARLTMERVAAESGVAKTTLYRHWPTRATLCMELYLDVAGRELQDPDTGDVAGDFTAITNTVVHLQTHTVAGPAFLGLIAEALVNPSTRAAFLAEFTQRRRELSRRVLRRAIDRGELRADTDIDLVIDLVGGAITFRLLQGHAPVTPAVVRDAVTMALAGCRATHPPRERKETQ